jgi:hypothetical protein
MIAMESWKSVHQKLLIAGAECYNLCFQTRYTYADISKAALQKLTDQEYGLSALALELEDQKRSRCRYQKEARDFENELASLKRRIVSPPARWLSQCTHYLIKA